MRGRRRQRHERPRLVHLTTTDMSLDWLLAPQLQQFADAGYEVIGMSAPGPHVEHLAELQIAHIPVPSFTRSQNPLQDLRAFGQLVRILRRVRPDVLHTHNPKPGVLGRIAGRLARVPLVVNTQHGLYAQPDDRALRRYLVYGLERLAAAFSDVELVQNEEDVRTLVEVLRVPKRRVRLLGNGVDLTRFDPQHVSDDSRRQIREEWGIGDDHLICGVVGRLVAEKGIEELFEAAHLMRERGLPVRMVVVGPTEETKADAVHSALLARADADGVVLAGQRTDMPEIYAAFDVFATASWREGFPRCVMEASAMGLPVVATDIRGNRQAVRPGETGLLVPVREPTSLADAIETLVLDASQRSTQGAAARRLALAEFDQQRVIERTQRAYELLAP